MHKILTNTCYASGRWPYGVRSSRDGRKHDPSTVIQIPVPVLIEQNVFDRVQSKLAWSNPKTTPPRVVNGPIAPHGHRGLCLVRLRHDAHGNDQQAGRSYSYYSCAGCQQKGKTVCKGRHIPAATLDDIVLSNLKQRVLAPERIVDLLKSLIERQTAKSESADHRLLALQQAGLASAAKCANQPKMGLLSKEVCSRAWKSVQRLLPDGPKTNIGFT